MSILPFPSLGHYLIKELDKSVGIKQCFVAPTHIHICS